MVVSPAGNVPATGEAGCHGWLSLVAPGPSSLIATVLGDMLKLKQGYALACVALCLPHRW